MAAKKSRANRQALSEIKERRDEEKTTPIEL